MTWRTACLALSLGGLVLFAAAAINLWPLPVLGRELLAPLAVSAAVVGLLVAPIPTLAAITTIGAIKLDAVATLPEGLDWTMPWALMAGVGVGIRLVTDLDPRPYPRTLLMFAIGLAALWLISTWWSEAPLYGSTKALAFLGVTGVIAIGPAVYLRANRHWWWYLGTMMALAALVSLELLRHAALEADSRSAFGGSYLGSARIIGLGILMAITTVLIRPGLRSWTLLVAAGVGMGLTAMLKSGARGPLLSLALTLLVLTIASRRGPASPSRRRLGWIALGFPLGAALALLLFPDRFETMLVRGALLVTMHGDSIDSRVERVGLAQRLWEEAPLLGQGAGSFNWAFGWGEKWRGAYPHNLLLEALSETGLLGGALLIGLLLWGCLAIWRLSACPAAYPWITPVTGLFCYSLLNAMVSGDLNSNRGVFASLGLLASLHLRVMPNSGVSTDASLSREPLRDHA